MRVLSIDPGSLLMGWAFFDGNKLVDSGCEKFKGKYSGKKAKAIQKFLLNKVLEYTPDHVVCEKYFAHNTKGALVIPEVRGLIRLVAATINIELEEVAYNTVQRVVTGKGNCGKEAVKAAVEKMFGIVVESLDQSDSVAIGYTYIKEISK
jgi:crossover junction endodeoxyribonuclease RuvC